MTQFEKYVNQREKIKRLKETMRLYTLSEEQREAVYQTEKAHGEGRPSTGQYSLRLDEIIQ